MISAVTLENYKGHTNTRVELGRITVLVGPNGSGKTSVLEALRDVSALLEQPHAKLFVEERSLEVISRIGADHMTIAVKVDKGAPVAFAVVRTPGGWKSGRDFAAEKPGPRPVKRPPPPGSPPPQFTEDDRTRLAVLRGASVYRLDARVIAPASFTTDAKPHVGLDGADTAPTLGTMKLEEDGSFARVEAGLTALVPSLRRVKPRRVVRGAQVGYALSFDFASGADLPSAAASEGTLVTTALLTLLHQADAPHVLLLDDIERSLHPAAQLELVRQLKQLVADRPDVQIVATTHSPYILDGLEPEDVRVFAMRDDGTIVAKKLSEHPDAARMQGSLTTGQLWSLDPELSWVGKPA